VGEERSVQVVVRGRVQGVGFRAWTRAEAARLGLSGSVRNRDDGAVEAVLSGAAATVDAMLAALHRGPAGAGVTEVSVAEAAPASGGFAILR
jgi:acylphosphatase